jgi:hypothetical protein
VPRSRHFGGTDTRGVRMRFHNFRAAAVIVITSTVDAQGAE